MSVCRLSLLSPPTINAKSGWVCTGMAIGANKEGNCAKILPPPSAQARCDSVLGVAKYMASRNKRAPPRQPNWMTSTAPGELAVTYFAVSTASRLRPSITVCPGLPVDKPLVKTKPR